MILIFDLDGTILDIQKRMGSLWELLHPESGISSVDYWRLRRLGLSSPQIESLASPATISTKTFIRKQWLLRIESLELLDQDSVHTGVGEFLADIHSQMSVVLCTARQHSKRTLLQLSSLGIRDFFSEILITEGRDDKLSALRGLPGLADSDWYVGDTLKDVELGRKLGIRTAAATCGLHGRSVLKSANPDLMLTTLGDLANFL